MKIVCDSCGTKYSIADDKVRGKVFKIRCKKCSHIIVVRGNEGGAATTSGSGAHATVAPAAGEGGGWHLVVDGDQVGPISDADVKARIERGEINSETYVWKEGFADWLKLSAIPDFAHLVQPAEGGVFADGTGSGSVNGSSEAPAASGGGLFGAAAASGGDDADVFGGLAPAASRGGGGDLFASSAAAKPASSGSSWPAPAAAAAPHDGGRVENLTGQRHENSVLFSLSNLQSLATTAPAAKPLSSAAAAPTTEGSGLIDIRAMAASTLGSPASAGPSFGGGGGGGAGPDDLPSFGSFAPAAPVLLALPTNSGPPKWIYGVIGLAVVLVGLIVVMAIKVLSKPVGPEVATAPAATAPAAPEAAKTAVAVNTPPAAPAKPTTIAEDKLPPREEPKAAEAKTDSKEKSDKGGDHHKTHGDKADKGAAKDSGGGKAKESKPVAAAAPAPEPEAKKPAKGSLDDLLEGALNHKPAPAAKPRVSDDDGARAAAPAASSGPLAKSAVVAGMNSVKGKVADCYNQFKVPGMAMVNVVIGKNGHVSSATVTGKFAGTPTGACVEKAVKTASFPPSDGLTTPYPFQLK
jgi:predicted Zn finger-like uncharacterized protein